MAQEQSYGGFWVRLVALTLDNAVIFVILLAAVVGLGSVFSMTGMGIVVGTIIWVVITFLPLLYWPVLESSGWQATVGKRIMGLQVTDADGARLSFVHALLRMLAKIVSSIPMGLGFLIAAFTARKQALHDIITKTLVVRTGPSHFLKAVLALIIGFVLMVASAGAFIYYFLMPMFEKTFGDTVQATTKDAPQRKVIPAPAPTQADRAVQPQPQPGAQPTPAPQAVAPAPAPAPAPTPAPAPAPAPAAVAEPAPAPVSKPASKPRAEPKAPPSAAKPLGQTTSQCVFKPVMTDEEIARCR
jgi:uncharacterized RDD family membrane protein YckC